LGCLLILSRCARPFRNNRPLGQTHSIAAELGEDIPLHPECFFLSDLDRDLLADSIDAFMNAGRRAQNAVLPYLTSALRKSLPDSLSKVFTKQGQTNLRKYPVLASFAPVLESYWQDDGQRRSSHASDYRAPQRGEGRP
jgi:hypothetical protein